MSFQNRLSVRWDGKCVPYGRSERAGGSVNYGFINLKGHPERVDSIPELTADAALRTAAAALLQPDCGLFSVGCLSGEVAQHEGFRMTGYLEFAINSETAATDASSYFPLFFHFDRHLHEIRFGHRVQLDWELQPATFLDARIDGCTCAVTVNTHFYESLDEAKSCWRATFDVLALCLGTYPVQSGKRLY